jgi:hypothetical protein
MLYSRDESGISAQSSNAVKKAGSSATVEQNQRNLFKCFQLETPAAWSYTLRHGHEQRLLVNRARRKQCGLLF